ncbi:MAG: hypothetical protein M3P18_18085 [Actinomycetota bacterium]|nr:hypothetical protein [Actinomycetota bacterium]
MGDLVRRAVEKVTSLLPPGIAARIDLLRPDLAKGFGPFNGQERRQAILAAIMRSNPFDLVIESGTFRGTTTEQLRKLTSAPIVTIEVSGRYHEYARRRLSGLPGIEVIRGDSPTEIRRVASRPTHDPKASVFAYLDAHWGQSLPARWEIVELLTGWDSVCIVVDDFKVPGDSGYGYDDYGPGMALEIALLDGLPLAGVSTFFPRIKSAEETGFRRGWVVLARGRDLVAHLSSLDGLTVAEQPAVSSA